MSRSLSNSVSIMQGHTPELEHGGISIVIDVLRAFTTAHYAFEAGVNNIYLAGTIAEAKNIARENGGSCLLAGERKALPIEGFHFGNSPAQIARADLAHKDLVLTTTNGVTSALHALQYGQVYLTGFSNAAKTAQFVRQLLKQEGPKQVNIVASHPTGDDDLACAEYIRSIILGDTPNPNETILRIQNCEAAKKFLDPKQPKFNLEDLELTLKMFPSHYVMEACKKDFVMIRKCEYSLKL